ncbi:MAG: hypothetical protein SP1CHLAM54_18040 [Chlamydiia bacterium]|nr:hypothetical protein [Chlamydiia bacterium]MCH9616691.1 hypothetical protein [Chlamydiia bacterium]MCH9629422.1 hypothetical protein [Chlamydiia bacterium]
MEQKVYLSLKGSVIDLQFFKRNFDAKCSEIYEFPGGDRIAAVEISTNLSLKAFKEQIEVDAEIILFGREIHHTAKQQIPVPSLTGSSIYLRPLLDLTETIFDPTIGLELDVKELLEHAENIQNIPVVSYARI